MTKKASTDMRGLKLTGGKIYSARLSIPKAAGETLAVFTESNLDAKRVA